MRTVGIIAEYNPLHTGHAYHIKKAREKTGADYVIAVMSPDFVQRGEPAVFDKYTRTKMALLSGADLVLELPVCYAAGSAEYFAQGAVRLLDALSVTDFLCFGTEEASEDAASYLALARELLEEPKAYRESLKENLRQGMSFPKARSNAARDPKGLLLTPNASLGVEYCKALLKFGSGMKPVPVLRRGSNYAFDQPEGEFCSALAIRKMLCQKGPAGETEISSYIPSSCRPLFDEAKNTALSADDFLWLINQKLLYTDDFDKILDISKDLSKRIQRLRYSCIGKSFEEIVSILQSKQITKSRIRRALIHLVLDIRASDIRDYRNQGTIFYARILGFRRKSSALLHEIKKRSSVPLIAKTSKADELLNGAGKRMWKSDTDASHLYRSIGSVKYNLPFQSEYTKSPVIL